MANNNDQWQTEFIIGGTILFAVVILIAIAGAFLAAGAVLVFCVNEWRKIIRYEGWQPIQWLGGITAFVALIGISAAATELDLASQAQARNRPSGNHIFLAMVYIAMIALPTVGYWIYRLIKPLSHVRINIVELLDQDYRQGKITRLERDTETKKYISMSDDELEAMAVNARRAREQQAASAPAPAPPPQPANIIQPANHSSPPSPPANKEDPRDAFDVPPQRIDK